MNPRDVQSAAIASVALVRDPRRATRGRRDSINR